MPSPLIVLTVLASVASVASLAIAAPSVQSKASHVIYAVVVTAVVGSSTLLAERSKRHLAEAARREATLQAQVQAMESRASEARAILRTYPPWTTEVGPYRGFVLASFAFLEKHQGSWPETYVIAKKLVIDGLSVAEAKGDLAEKKALENGASAMKAILEGLSSLEQTQ